MLAHAAESVGSVPAAGFAGPFCSAAERRRTGRKLPGSRTLPSRVWLARASNAAELANQLLRRGQVALERERLAFGGGGHRGDPRLGTVLRSGLAATFRSPAGPARIENGNAPNPTPRQPGPT